MKLLTLLAIAATALALAGCDPAPTPEVDASPAANSAAKPTTASPTPETAPPATPR